MQMNDYRIRCRDCKTIFTLEYSTYKKGVDAGEIADPGLADLRSVKTYTGICDNCKKDDIKRRIGFREEIRTLIDRARHTMQKHEYEFEDALHVEIERAYDPRNESDEGFRQYLLEREAAEVNSGN